MNSGYAPHAHPHHHSPPGPLRDVQRQLPLYSAPYHPPAQHHPQHLPPMSAPPPATYGADPYAAQHSPAEPPTPGSASGVETKPKSPGTMARIQQAIKATCKEHEGRRYKLDVVQQPQRARMCGFGDKDRRPITPPPCIRLVVIDALSGEEINCNNIDHTLYVLNVELWAEDGSKDVNCVKSTSATPSISSTQPISYIEAINASNQPSLVPILPSGRDPGYAPMGYPQPAGMAPYGMPPQAGGFPGYPPNGYGAPGQLPFGSHEFRPDMHPGMPQLASQSMHYRPPHVMDPPFGQRIGVQSSAAQGKLDRNLIGSLAVSAFRLQDMADKIGIWFIMQDLSVRTEGTFRLRFSFVNVGPLVKQVTKGDDSALNKLSAPVLATCFSEPFQVYSAKKFPGVCESTALSKCFAGQGIKIPIRKEGPANKGGGDDEDDF